MNKKGFTLVELIATIAIILLLGLIVTPKIMNVINENRIKGYKEIERRLEEAAGKYIIENYTDSSLPFIKIEKNQLIEGKYIDEIYDLKDKSVCDAYVMVSNLNKTADFNVNLRCSSYKSMLKTTAHVEDLYYDIVKRSSNGLEKTSDGNIRYAGSSPKNYVEFGNTNELWRIIGLFEVTTASGKTEKLMKIVRNDSIGWYSWDSSESSVNNGLGVNQWGEVKDSNGNILYSGADLKTELNELYLNKYSGTCYNDANNASTPCDFGTIGINSPSRNMIENVVWNTGAFTYGTMPVLTAYQEERGMETGKKCTSGENCNDDVMRTVTWVGKVGLIYPSDYGYASLDATCGENIMDDINKSCQKDNWLHNSSDNYGWTLSPVFTFSMSNNAWTIGSTGVVYREFVYITRHVRPSVYLKSNVSIISGVGTESNPYKLSLNS